MGEPQTENGQSATRAIKVLFYGGLDLVFKGARSLDIQLPVPTASTTPKPVLSPTVRTLINHLATSYVIPHKKSLFAKDDSVTPGILVLVNDADWELEGKEDCELHDGDEVVFVSTLHGG